jgi:hypothetical protein
MRKTIGIKSSGEIAILTSLLILSAGSFILLLVLDEDITKPLDQFRVYLLAFITLFFLVMLIMSFLKPKVMIVSDQECLYLNYRRKKIKILLKDIIQATPQRLRARGFYYSFGFIKVYTKKQMHKIGYVASCEDVALDIMREVNDVKTGEKQRDI